MKAFLCHSSNDSKFVLKVARYLETNLKGIFYYERYQRSNESFIQTITDHLNKSDVFILFIGSQLTHYQLKEANIAQALDKKKKFRFFNVLLSGQEEIPEQLNFYIDYPILCAAGETEEEAFRIAKAIVSDFLRREWIGDDNLPLDPHLFDYEKDIIQFFIRKARIEATLPQLRQELEDLTEDDPEFEGRWKEYEALDVEYENIRAHQLGGCPAEWPEVVRWKDEQDRRKNELDTSVVGSFRPENARVVAAALTNYLSGFWGMEKPLCFPEAGPREWLVYPRAGQNLNVAVIVSGGIAPGINAVIDGITQRHFIYAKEHGYRVHVFGLRNGFLAFSDLHKSHCNLIPGGSLGQGSVWPGPGVILETSSHANQGGSILGTSRFEDLINNETRERELENIVQQLFNWKIDILYVIGGDGSMKAAHAIWSFAQAHANRRALNQRLSVVAIPKTMDNDILWVWQTFGFLSAVERARELIEHLGTEVRSNPRLGVVQLFGSDSGFVVSHAVLASTTGIVDAALIPEASFSMEKLAGYLRRRMYERLQEHPGRIPYGFVVLAETAIPTDAMDFLGDEEIGLSENEKAAVCEFQGNRKAGERIQGQTDDALRTAGLKIVSRGLKKLLSQEEVDFKEQPDWTKLRVFTNEPRHLLRATPPRTSDIITAQRMGMLAVDNALAGYTDCMVSQWLTEYVLVPLKLVVLGRKRIPKEGIFWKSVLAKTGQDF